MTNIYVLNKDEVADFDVVLSTPLFASTNKSLLESKASELNAARSKSDIINEIEYSVSHETIKLI